jgi:hypothetical protein
MDCYAAGWRNIVPNNSPMRKSVIAIGFAIGVFVPTSSAYANDNVAALLQQCNAEYASTDWFYCVGKVGGISDVMDLNGLLYSSGKGGTNPLNLPEQTYSAVRCSVASIQELVAKPSREMGRLRFYRSDDRLAGGMAMPLRFQTATLPITVDSCCEIAYG